MKHILQCCIWACFCLVLAQTSKAQVSSVNHSSGTMGVNIPLYTLTEGSLSVPISLSYDGSGVSVDAIASVVGVFTNKLA